MEKKFPELVVNLYKGFVKIYNLVIIFWLIDKIYFQELDGSELQIREAYKTLFLYCKWYYPIPKLFLWSVLFTLITSGNFFEKLVNLNYYVCSQKEMVWIHGPFLQNFKNMLKIAGRLCTEGTDLLKLIRRAPDWPRH